MNTLVIRERDARAKKQGKKLLIILAVVAIIAGLAFLLLPPAAHAGSVVGPRLAAREAATRGKTPVDPAPAPPAAGEGTVNLNSASEDELMLLPGVGPSKADAIVAYRKKFGSFKKVDDLGKVKGFGYKTLKRLRPFLAVSGTTTYKGSGKKSRSASPEAGKATPAPGSGPASP